MENESKYDELLNIVSEKRLTHDIVIPLFQRMLYSTQYSHGTDEISHKSDAFAILSNDTYAIAIQVKHKKDIKLKKSDVKTVKNYETIANRAKTIFSNKKYDVKKEDISAGNSINEKDIREITNSARKAISHLISKSDKIIPISKFYWITTGQRKHANSYNLEQTEINKWPELRNRVEIWDQENLISNLIQFYPEAFIYTRIGFYENQATEQIMNGNSLAASFCYYKAAISNFEYLGLHGFDKVQEGCKTLISKAIEIIGDQVLSNRYYYRVLKEFYLNWKKIITNNIEFNKFIIKYNSNFPLKDNQDLSNKYLLSFSIYSVFKEKCSSSNDLLFLTDVQYIIDHLGILYDEFANAKSGLSSLQVSRLLLRAGFPIINRSENPLKQRFDRIKKEISNSKIDHLINNNKDEYEHCRNNSLDGGCTLCTGTALSCLALANQKESKEYRNALNWLLFEDKISSNRWCYIIFDQLETDPWKHSMSYAASVLLAFLDCGKLDENIQEAWNCFNYFFSGEILYKKNKKDSLGFKKEWMSYRNESQTAVIQHICSSLIRVFLSFPKKFAKNEINVLNNNLDSLINLLMRSADEAESPWVLYETRENLESLCLKLLLNENDTKTLELIEEVLKLFRLQIERQLLRESRIFDSNIDRTRKFLEGWLTYWEVKLFLQEKNNTGYEILNNKVF